MVHICHPVDFCVCENAFISVFWSLRVKQVSDIVRSGLRAASKVCLLEAREEPYTSSMRDRAAGFDQDFGVSGQ